MSIYNWELKLLGSDIKCITRELLVGDTCTRICHLPGSPGINIFATCIPCFLKPGSLTQKVPRSSTLDPCQVPTILHSINVFELFFRLCRTCPGALVLLNYISYTKSCKHALASGVQEARVSTFPFQWGKSSLPIRNSILQHQEATEVTVRTLLWWLTTTNKKQVQ